MMALKKDLPDPNPLTNSYKLSFTKGVMMIEAESFQIALDRANELGETAKLEIVSIKRMRLQDDKDLL